MKVHWGAGVTGAFILFGAAVFVMVSISVHERIDLVSDDYYDKELKHQDRIDEVRRTRERGLAPAITVSGGSVRIAFPVMVDRSAISGEVSFYRPSDRRMDFRIPLQLDSANVQEIVSTGITAGRWRIQVRWVAEQTSFYHEDTVIVR